MRKIILLFISVFLSACSSFEMEPFESAFTQEQTSPLAEQMPQVQTLLTRSENVEVFDISNPERAVSSVGAKTNDDISVVIHELTGAAHNNTKPIAQPRSSIATNPIRSGDTLTIAFFGQEDLSGEYEIDPRGMLTFPLIGSIEAAGLSKSQLEARIKNKLIAEEYFQEPHLNITKISHQPFYILGEVRTPGAYPYVANLDVVRAIAIAGGYTPRASKNKITISRYDHESEKNFQASESTKILPGDSIRIEQRFF